MAANRLKVNAEKTELLWVGSRFSVRVRLGSRVTSPVQFVKNKKLSQHIIFLLCVLEVTLSDFS